MNIYLLLERKFDNWFNASSSDIFIGIPMIFTDSIMLSFFRSLRLRARSKSCIE